MATRKIKNLNLFSIRLPLPALVSILHRMSGVILFLLMPLMIWAFCYSLTSELNFNFILLLMDSWLVKSIEVLFIWALLHHLIAGLRHLLLDFQIGTDLIVARLSSKTVLIVSFMLTALSVNWI